MTEPLFTSSGRVRQLLVAEHRAQVLAMIRMILVHVVAIAGVLAAALPRLRSTLAGTILTLGGLAAIAAGAELVFKSKRNKLADELSP